VRIRLNGPVVRVEHDGPPENARGYRGGTIPDEPIIVHTVRNPNKPGLPRKSRIAPFSRNSSPWASKNSSLRSGSSARAC
jgi:hypothetical protein